MAGKKTAGRLTYTRTLDSICRGGCILVTLNGPLHMNICAVGLFDCLSDSVVMPFKETVGVCTGQCH